MKKLMLIALLGATVGSAWSAAGPAQTPLNKALTLRIESVSDKAALMNLLDNLQTELERVEKVEREKGFLSKAILGGVESAEGYKTELMSKISAVLERLHTLGYTYAAPATNWYEKAREYYRNNGGFGDLPQTFKRSLSDEVERVRSQVDFNAFVERFNKVKNTYAKTS